MNASRTLSFVIFCATFSVGCGEDLLPASDASSPDVVVVDQPTPVDQPATDNALPEDVPSPDVVAPVDVRVPLDAGSPAGAACTQDSDCADGWCADLPSGYCSRRRCDMNDCPSGSMCNYLVRSSAPSIYVCLRECTAPSGCRVADGYTCDRGLCVTARPDAGPPVDTGRRCSSNLGRDCPVGQACSASGQCTTACSFDWRCNGGCCNNGRCAAGTDLNACGTSSASAWRCGDCSRGCTSGAACRAVTNGGACACTSCRPIGGSCSTSTDCCTRSCAGLNGNLTCQG